MLTQRSWAQSIAVHFGVAMVLAILLWRSPGKQKRIIVPVVIENPQVQPQPVLKISAPVEPNPPTDSRKVFGASRKSVEAENTGLAVKAGNTLTIAPDKNVLAPSDAEALPIPTDEYLVTSMPSVIAEIKIPYPAEARKAGIEGPVVLDLLIDVEGKVRAAELVSGPQESLNLAALEAVKNFRFRPARAEGRPVAVRIRYVYRFVLEK